MYCQFLTPLLIGWKLMASPLHLFWLAGNLLEVPYSYYDWLEIYCQFLTLLLIGWKFIASSLLLFWLVENVLSVPYSLLIGWIFIASSLLLIWLAGIVLLVPYNFAHWLEMYCQFLTSLRIGWKLMTYFLYRFWLVGNGWLIPFSSSNQLLINLSLTPFKKHLFFIAEYVLRWQMPWVNCHYENFLLATFKSFWLATAFYWRHLKASDWRQLFIGYI